MEKKIPPNHFHVKMRNGTHVTHMYYSSVNFLMLMKYILDGDYDEISIVPPDIVKRKYYLFSRR